mmetsp:Transcript_11910/g.41153  ORF Transcript_11910/g.41153 Transcript_11910/m.41153 type:complete len:203 (+) Transcript_11910:892-1500(+)
MNLASTAGSRKSSANSCSDVSTRQVPSTRFSEKFSTCLAKPMRSSMSSTSVSSMSFTSSNRIRSASRARSTATAESDAETSFLRASYASVPRPSEGSRRTSSPTPSRRRSLRMTTQHVMLSVDPLSMDHSTSRRAICAASCSPLCHAARTNATACSLETFSQMPSHATMINSSAFSRGRRLVSGQQLTSCSWVERASLDLYT